MYINLHQSMDYNVIGTVLRAKTIEFNHLGENSRFPTYTEHDFCQVAALLLSLDFIFIEGL